MRKLFFVAILLCSWVVLKAQNIQLHYDFGRTIYSTEESSRQKVTMTLEQFKADKWGSWFYFVDIDFSRKFTESAYTEISRELNIGKKGFAGHVEYNGGLNKGGSFQQAGLIGGAWNGHNADFSTTYSVQVLYKHYFKSYDNTHSYASAQLTGVWSTTFANRALTFAGYIDFWRGEAANGHGQLVIQSEPQLWYNATEYLSIGTEIEISDNFIYNTANNKSFFVNPTIGLKWKF